MKRSLLILGLLLVLSVTGVCMGSVCINRTRDQVRFTQSTVWGDARLADGLQVETDVNYKRHLHWDTVTQLSPNPESRTDWHFTAASEHDVRVTEPIGLQLDTLMEHGVNTSASLPTLTGIPLAYRELYEDTKPGERRERTILLSDYYEYYPVRTTLELYDLLYDGENFGEYAETPEFRDEESRLAWEEEKKFHEDMQNFIRIPILEGQTMILHLERSAHRDSLSFGSSWTDESDTYWLSCESVITDDACFFILTNRSSKGNIMDFSEIPGGYGIYRLPLGKDEQGMTEVHSGELAMVYALEEEQRVEALSLSEDGTQLLLFTHTERGGLFSVIRIADMTCVQELEMPASGELRRLHAYADFLVLETLLDELILFEQTGQLWRQGLRCAKCPDEVPYFTVSYGSHMDWDGKRLAAAIWHDDEQAHWATCGFELAVYAEDRLAYYGRYKSSLTEYIEPQVHDVPQCEADYYDALRVSWN